MFKLISHFYNYLSLYLSIRKYIQHYTQYKSHNFELLDIIIHKINLCGSVAIKLTQWIIPKLEIMISDKDNIINNKKESFILHLESLYENCNYHTIEDSKEMFKNNFHIDFDEDYKIIKIIGSGSIGQTYLIQNTHNGEKYVMKVIHPNVREDIYYFRKLFNVIQYISCLFPCFMNHLNRFPFDINHFITDFNLQSDFINESNNLLTFFNYFSDNPFIIIPRLYKCSKDIILMSYEEGLYVDDLIEDSDNYLKNSVVLLYYLFINNNEQCTHFNHGDLHRGNWRYTIIDGKPRLIIYDFGFCFNLEKDKRYIIDLIVETFEKTDITFSDDIVDILTTITLEILIDFEQTNDNISKLKDHIQLNIDQIKPWCFSAIDLAKMFIEFSIIEKCKINHHLIQFFIIAIQCNHLYEQFNYKGKDDEPISGYQVHRERYLDVINFCDTNNIFQDYNDLIKQKITKYQPEVNDLFDTITMPDSIKELALS